MTMQCVSWKRLSVNSAVGLSGCLGLQMLTLRRCWQCMSLSLAVHEPFTEVMLEVSTHLPCMLLPAGTMGTKRILLHQSHGAPESILLLSACRHACMATGPACFFAAARSQSPHGTRMGRASPLPRCAACTRQDSGLPACAGIMVCGGTVAEAFDAMYYLEQVSSLLLGQERLSPQGMLLPSRGHLFVS